MKENKIYSNIINMREQDLSNLTKKELINLLLKQNTKIKLLKNKLQRPVPTPQKNVKLMKKTSFYHHQNSEMITNRYPN